MRMDGVQRIAILAPYWYHTTYWNGWYFCHPWLDARYVHAHYSRENGGDGPREYTDEARGIPVVPPKLQLLPSVVVDMAVAAELWLWRFVRERN